MYSQYFRKPIFKLVFVVWFFLIFFLLSPKTVLADKTWDGGGGADSNWNTCTNWTTDVCPASDQTTDIAIFNATSSNNVTISSSITAKGISIASGYGGIITQNNSFTMTLGASGFSQATATFLGGNSAIDVNGDFVISGGAFTSTSGTVTISGNFTKTNSPTFTHNSGTVTFDGATFADTTISASGVTFNLVIINRSFNNSTSKTLTIATGTTLPLGNTPTLTLSNPSGATGFYHLTNNGTITLGTGIATLTVDGILTNTGSITGSNTSLVVNGSISNSGTITMSSSAAYDFNVNDTVGGSLTNSGTAIFTTATDPSFTIAGNFIIANTSTFPSTNTNIDFDGASIIDSTIDAPGVTFLSPVTISRTINFGVSKTMTIVSGTTIPLGNTPTLTINNTNTQYSLTNNGTITIGTGVATFTVDGTLTNTGTISGSNSSFILNGSLTNSGTVTMSSSTSFDINTTSLLEGSLTNSGTAIFTTGSDPSFTIAGSFVIANTSTFPSTNTNIDFDGTSAIDSSIDASGVTFQSPVTISRTFTNAVSKTMTIVSGTTIPLGNSSTITLNNTNAQYNLTNAGNITVGTGVFTTNIDGVFTNGGTITGTNTSLIDNGSITNSGSISMPSCSTFEVNIFDGAGGSFINSSTGSVATALSPTFTIQKDFNINISSTFPTPINLVLDGITGTQTLTTPVLQTFGTFSKTGASSLTLSNGIVTGGFTLSGGTISNPASSYDLKISGDFSETSTGTLGGGNLSVIFDGGNNQTISKTAGNFSSSMAVNKSGGVLRLLTTFTTVGTTCTVTSGVFYLNSFVITCGGTFTIQASGTLRLIGNEVISPPVIDLGSTVEYVGDGDSLIDSYSINNWGYSNLTINFTDSADSASAAVSPLNVSKNFTLSGGTFTAPSVLNIGGNYSNTGGTFTHNSGSVVMNSTSTGNTLSGSMTSTSSFYNLTFSGLGGEWSFASNPAVEIENDFTITLGTVTSTNNVLGLSIKGNYSNSGTFTHNSGTVIFNAIDVGNTLGGTMTTSSSFYNLTFTGSGGEWSFGTSPSTVAYDLIVTLGTVTAPSTTLNVGHNFTNNSTFTHNSGTVVLNGTAQTITGNTTFNNLTKTVSSPDTLNYEGHVTNTTTVVGTWTMKGILGNLLTLYSTSSPTRWRIAPTGTRNIEYLSVKDSNNVDASTILTAGLNITNEGQNINWSFNQNPGVPTNLGPTSLINGSWSTDNTPTFTFDLSDPDLDTMKYEIQIDNNSNFLSLEDSFISSLSITTSRSCTSAILSDGSYYWRVKSIDSSNTESNWTNANGGLVAFKIDTLSPSMSGTPTTTSPTLNTTPTWTWTISSDSGIGLHATPYLVEWCLDSTFTGCSLNTVTTATNSYSHSTSLAPGTWYSRVKTKDLLNSESAYSLNGSVVVTVLEFAEIISEEPVIEKNIKKDFTAPNFTLPPEVIPEIPPVITPIEEVYTLDLTIVDSNNTPVVGATVTISGDKTIYITDKNGKVSIKNLEKGEYKVIVNQNGITTEQKIVIGGTDSTLENIIEVKQKEVAGGINPVLFCLAGIILLLLLFFGIKLFLKSKEKGYSTF